MVESENLGGVEIAVDAKGVSPSKRIVRCLEIATPDPSNYLLNRPTKRVGNSFGGANVDPSRNARDATELVSCSCASNA